MKTLYSQLLMKFFRFNYQLLWEEQDQPAFKNFPQALTHTEHLPFIIHHENKHPLCRDPTKLHVQYFESISYDTNFLLNILKHLIIDHSYLLTHAPTIPFTVMILLHHTRRLKHFMTHTKH